MPANLLKTMECLHDGQNLCLFFVFISNISLKSKVKVKYVKTAFGNVM